MSEKYISLENLKEYNEKVKETYIKPLEDKFVKLDAGETGGQDIIGDLYIYSTENEESLTSLRAGYLSLQTPSSEVTFTDGSLELYQYEDDGTSNYAAYSSDGIYSNLGNFHFPQKIEGEDHILATMSDINTSIISTTWAELKQLRDTAQLIPGQFYRITDYECTTIQKNTRAMNHQFDIIVQALSNNELSENASADYHDEDTYFHKVGDVEIIDSNIISELAETTLEESEVEWVYTIREDCDNFGDNYTGIAEGQQKDDVFVAFNFLENNNGIIVPVLYKNDMYIDEETGNLVSDYDEPDYGDPYFYIGEQEIDGVIYDKWRKIELDTEEGIDPWGTEYKIYALTNKIVGVGLLIEATFTYGGGKQNFANLPAWELKYCLDNDTGRFAWADNTQYIINLESALSQGRPLSRQPACDRFEEFGEDFDAYHYAWGTFEDADDGDSSNFIYSKTENITNGDTVWSAIDEEFKIATIRTGGKGVIYYMKDEWNNECPYDFKNIQFKRYAIIEMDEASTNSTFVGHYFGDSSGTEYSIDENDFIWCYTFSWLNENDIIEDVSILGQYLTTDEGYYIGVYDNIIKQVSNSNFTVIDEESFKISLNNIVFLSEYSYDDGNFYGCYSNTFSNNCYSNTFGNRCYSNTFGEDCQDNIFGNWCFHNNLGNKSRDNIFSNNCNSIIFGNECFHNIFGNECSSITFGNDCYSNIFGNKCSSITFGNNCYYNTFGNSFKYNAFGNGCYKISIPQDYVRYINIAEGCGYIQFINYDNTFSDDFEIQNVMICQGVCGTMSESLKLQVNRSAAPVIFRAKNTTEIILD
jgi:hypothetical protein